MIYRGPGRREIPPITSTPVTEGSPAQGVNSLTHAPQM